MPPQRTRSMHITDSVIKQMAAQDQFVGEFDFLRPIRTNLDSGHCGTCTRTVDPEVQSAFEAAKIVIGQMADDRKSLMKQMLKIDIGIVIYRTGPRELTKIKF